MLHLKSAIKVVVRASRIILVVSLVVFTPSLPLSNGVQAAAGDLDLTFGIGSRALTDFRTFDQLLGVALQADGKIVGAGSSGTIESFSDDVALVRYNVNGSPDPSFGHNGLVTSDFSGLDESAAAVAIQSDGKIVIAGTINNAFSGTSRDVLLARYNTDGSLDITFGTGGKVSTDFAIDQNDFGQALAIQPNGKILVAGYTDFFNTTHHDFAIARYNADGSLDATFGTGGKVVTDFMGGNDEANAIKVQSDGKIIIGGVANIVPFLTGSLPDHDADDFGLARYNADGSLDSSFGTNGKVITDFVGFRDRILALGIQSDGRIVAAGDTSYTQVQSSINTDFALARYTTNGALDMSFGTNGKVTEDFSLPDPGFASFDTARALVVQADNRIVVTGSAHAGFAFVKYNPNGDLDSRFGIGGKVVKQGLGQEEYFALAIQPDGKLVAAGFGGLIRDIDCVVARFNNDVFDLCIQDDSNGSSLQINTTTGEYQLTNCSGFVVGGIGTLTRRGCAITLQHNAADRRVLATIDTCQKKAAASIRLLSPGRTFTITDRNTANDTCACGN